MSAMPSSGGTCPSSSDRILQLLPDPPADAGRYRFVAPVLKALEHRPDGALLAIEEGSALPALLLEAQMQADPIFFLRLYGESGRFLLREKTIQRPRSRKGVEP